MRKTVGALGAVVLSVAVAACGSSGGGGSASNASSASNAASGGHTTLTVSAAASLTEAFDKIKTDFQKAHPGVTVKTNYGGSSSLAEQILNGAPADVFASANQKQMNKVVKAGDVTGKPTIFTHNTLEIAVPKGNPKHIRSFADLTKPGVRVVMCAAPVPCGSAVRKVEKAAHVTLHPKSEEQDVKSVLSKVRSRDADAGLVYVSDVATAGPQVQGVKFPQAKAAVNQYPVAVTKKSKHQKLAQQFIAMLTGKQGKKRLADAGFPTS